MQEQISNDELLLTRGALRIPKGQRLSSIRIWCEYAIWGLLFYDNQSPWMTMIEALQLAYDADASDAGLLPGLTAGVGGLEHETTTFSVPLNDNLRYLLFIDDDISEIAATSGDGDDAMFAKWFAKLGKRNHALRFKYLEEAFDDFGELSRAVELMRTAEIETHASKRPTSRHLIPLGHSLLFADTDENGNVDRRFLRRTGEILYLMLNRCRDRDRVRELLKSRLLDRDNPWERLGCRLAGVDEAPPAAGPIGYLPMPNHLAYDRLGEDWKAILELESIPVENLLEPLARLSAMDQLLYVVERSADVIGDGRKIAPFLLDFGGRGGSAALREESSLQYNRHRHMVDEAIENFVDGFLETTEWLEMLERPTARKEAVELIARRFRFRPDLNTTSDQYPDPDEQIAELRQEALSRKGHTIATFFVAHARKAGLLTARQGAGTWYAPTDQFLEALVLANVTVPLEFDDFLDRLYRRYRIVAGRSAALAAYGQSPLPLQVLMQNEERLEERLRVLGFLERKSDACAFVINPFHRKQGAISKEPAYAGP